MAAYDRNLMLVRELLNVKAIKLWLAPYTIDDEETGSYSEDLIDECIQKMKTSRPNVIEILEELRINALRKLKSNEKFKTSGIATLKVKITRNEGQEKDLLFIETPLSSLGQHLRSEISNKLDVSPDSLKLISCGRIIDDNISLEGQKLKNNGIIMCLIMSTSQTQFAKKESEMALLKSVREDAEFLLSNPNNSALQINDQYGNKMKMPKEERKALGIALTLHEKGRSFLKKKKYAKALTFLLEADEEFSHCNSDILEKVDNYALVCLDISWCYLCLHSITDLPDADRRLKLSEDCFLRSYGENCSRLATIKGGTENEKALFARLHLLQGIVAFHHNKLQNANELFNRTQEEIKELKVDDASVSQIAALGFKVSEARLALRACNNSTESAISHIIAQRENKAKKRVQEKTDRKKKLRAKALGTTINGDFINEDHLQSLLNLGFSLKPSKHALRHTNNNISDSCQILQLNPNFSPDFNEDPGSSSGHTNFDSSLLDVLNGNENNLVDAMNSVIAENNLDASEHYDKEKEKEAINRLSNDIPQEQDDHLNLLLADEEQVLSEYLALLEGENL